MQRRKVGAALAAGLLSLLTTATITAAPGHAEESAKAAEEVVEVPISFEVQNTNRTAVVCPSDGKQYTVRGTMVAPRSAIENPTSATLLLHAVTWGQYYYNFKGVEGYDTAQQLAERGHTSVLVDRLGYGSSDKPPGLATCFGSEADVAHQMVQALRSGDYTTKGVPAPKFGTVNIGGSSVGGLISNLEAATFRDVDSVINMAWGDFAATPFTAAGTADVTLRCLTGGDPGAPKNYAAFFKGQREKFYFNSAPPEVREAVPGLKPDPCGQVLSVPAAIAADSLLVSTIDVPVQVIFGDADPVFGPQTLAADQQALRYLNSPSVTKTIVPEASHYPLVEANQPMVVDEMDNFLTEHGS